MKKTLVCLLLLSTSMVFGQASLKQVFKKYGVEGSTTVYYRNRMVWFYSDSLDARRNTPPGATFNIVNAAIALETGALKAETEVIKWDGKKQNVIAWNKDTDLKTAFKNSNVWFFSEVAKKISHNDYAEFLKMCGYNIPAFKGKTLDFWNTADYLVNPVQQINFLRYFATGQLSFSPRTFNVVKGLMNTQKTSDYVLTDQTGLVKVNGKDTYWYIGYADVKDKLYYFATRIAKSSGQKNADLEKTGKEITLDILKQIKAIN